VGTMAEALRAGKPQIVVPFFGDHAEGGSHRPVREGGTRSRSACRLGGSQTCSVRCGDVLNTFSPMTVIRLEGGGLGYAAKLPSESRRPRCNFRRSCRPPARSATSARGRASPSGLSDSSGRHSG
jgi:hypothetical protein